MHIASRLEILFSIQQIRGDLNFMPQYFLASYLPVHLTPFFLSLPSTALYGHSFIRTLYVRFHLHPLYFLIIYHQDPVFYLTTSTSYHGAVCSASHHIFLDVDPCGSDSSSSVRMFYRIHRIIPRTRLCQHKLRLHYW